MPPPRADTAADLSLARACIAGDAAALARFDPLLRRAVAAARRLESSPSFADELTQTLRARLLGGAPGQPPRLSRYQGKGPLARWLEAVAVGTAVDLLRQSRRHAGSDDEVLFELPGETDPELKMMRERYRGELRRTV